MDDDVRILKIHDNDDIEILISDDDLSNCKIQGPSIMVPSTSSSRTDSDDDEGISYSNFEEKCSKSNNLILPRYKRRQYSSLYEDSHDRIKSSSHPRTSLFKSIGGYFYFSTSYFILLLVLLLSNNVSAKRKFKEQEIIQRVLKDYDWRVRPRGLNASWPDTGGPVIVTVNIYMRSISKIDDVNMEYSAQFTFREEWVDTRLAYERYEKEEQVEVPDFVVLATSENADQSQQIWMPDSFFQNEKEARRHMIDKPNVLIRIHKDGSILYSVRLSLVLSCPMKLEYYPLDHQKCDIDVASYAYTTDDIVFQWKAIEPIQRKPGLRKSLPSFDLQDIQTGYCNSITNTGTYSCLKTQLILKREFSYYLLQLYIPSCMLVIVSWVSFWLDKDSVPARVTLGVTTLLTMTTQSSGINAKLPPVSYTKAIDVWIGVCLAFIFGALLEFALVNYAARRDIGQNNHNRIVKMTQQTSDGYGIYRDGYQPLLSSNQGRSSFCCRIFVRRYKERSKRIDVVSRLVFPIGYAFFNVFYWAVYLL